MLEINSKMIDFSLADSEGKVHHLSDYLGKKVVLYFYPKDNTPGCSLQAQGYNNEYECFKAHNVEVIAISKDSVNSHKKFKEKYDLKFPLLSDESLEVINAYDVYKEKMNYGKKYMGVVRTTYVIDENGYIIYASDNVKAKSDALTLKEFLKCE